jgi:hypothetical protein
VDWVCESEGEGEENMRCNKENSDADRSFSSKLSQRVTIR